MIHAQAWPLTGYFLRLGATGFGGPIALVATMERELVGGRRWFSLEEFKEGLAFAQLAPGPLAAQLAIYLGWRRGGARGAALAGLAFVAPSLLLVLAISMAYVRAGELAWMRATFYGVGAAVIGVIARGAFGLARRTLPREGLLIGVALLNAATVALTSRELVSVVLASGVAVMLIRGPVPAGAAPSLVPAWLAVGLESGTASADTLWRLAVFFTEAGAVVFGSGLAIVPFLYGGVVQEHAWLTERQFVDAVAVAMLTPGPVVITVAFIGYLVAGPVGALIASLGVFLPVYVITVAGAPFYGRLSASPRVRGFVEGVTAAATGAIAGAVLVLAQRAIVDAPTAAIAALALLLPLAVRRLKDPVVLGAAALLGLIMY